MHVFRKVYALDVVGTIPEELKDLPFLNNLYDFSQFTISLYYLLWFQKCTFCVEIHCEIGQFR